MFVLTHAHFAPITSQPRFFFVVSEEYDTSVALYTLIKPTCPTTVQKEIRSREEENTNPSVTSITKSCHDNFQIIHPS